MFITTEGFDHFSPDNPCCAEFGDFHEEIHADVEEETEPGGEGVHVQPLSYGGAHVFQPVGDGIGQFLDDGGAGRDDLPGGDPDQHWESLQKLAQLVNVTDRRLEAELARIKPSPSRRRGAAPKREAASQVTPSLLSRPREEYCLALLLQHSEFKGLSQQPLAEYFQNSENRAIFTAWQESSTPSSLRERLDPALWEQLESLEKRSLPNNQLEKKYVDCVINLRKEYLRNLEAKRAELLALEVELKGAGADIVKLEEEGIETAIQLKEVFSQKGVSTKEPRNETGQL